MKSFKNWLSEGAAVAAPVDTAVVKSIECDCGRDKKPGEPMCDMCKKAKEKNNKRNEDFLYLAGVMSEEEMLTKRFGK